ncbi:hypothetical protein Pgy4_03230 [Pseudomonas savastanoi pv. glycinea str. race 4]|uniref:Uncharacterized protein n=1 Tax=Pseudomonas savastanoi pv. glycinea str. race 4 TaxID=875330 RepID=F3BZR0_PSESG|nr:hypothetical protein Pgy4_03230 [Pseudomonas savastanoi pv. glycinea str. race 4]
MQGDGFYTQPVGLVTKRLRFVYMHPQTFLKAQTWCRNQTATQQMLLPTPGQSWQHRAFFAHVPVLQGMVLAFMRPSAARMRQPVERLHARHNTSMVVL